MALPSDLKYCHPLFRANVRFINAGIAAGGNYRQVLFRLALSLAKIGQTCDCLAGFIGSPRVDSVTGSLCSSR